MRKHALTAASLLLFSLVAVAGHAYAQEYPMTAKIPFQFAVGNQILPAGEYRLEHLSPGNGYLLLLRRTDGPECTTMITTSIRANDWQDKSKLVFNRYGDHYFLAQIWTAGDNVGRKLSPSRRETEAASKQVKQEIALLVR